MSDTSASSAPINPLIAGIGSGLALTALIGIMLAYVLGHGKPTIYWATMGGTFVVSTLIGLGMFVARGAKS